MMAAPPRPPSTLLSYGLDALALATQEIDQILAQITRARRSNPAA
ncbi:hypothetical protein [Granulicella sp. WH15]|nr:hypothetical protein [Granulicella sp. WH15]